MVSPYKSSFSLPNLIFVVLVALSCSPISYKTLYSGSEDPTFDFKKTKTIGFVPMYWSSRAKELNVTELEEKQMYAYVKKELESRGYIVSYIPLEKCTTHGDTINLRSDLAEYPDLTVTMHFTQKAGQIEVPAQTGAFLGWGGGSGQGYYGQTGSYSANVWTLYVGIAAWSGKPEYMKQVWIGHVAKGSPMPDLNDKAESMISSLLYREKFPKNK